MSNRASPPPCDGCGTTERLSLIIHNVRHRGLIRHFCTHCLLSNHHGLFCPICFHVFIDTDDSPLPPSLRLMCLRCPSISHRSCSPSLSSSSDASSPAAFLCPTCADPKFNYFNLSAADRISRALDEKSFKVLAAASRIAAVSMTKGAAAARYDAERRAAEAAAAKKRAKEAIEHLATVQATEEEETENSCCVVDLNLNARLHVTE
ncbi:hypothetical protein RIF29_07151 [Crotalaria pallida]|uniref:Uncharacterized protein n=1 Tax=Crotalaria pallida TaxID=3830 RepID=A0AAN9J518_CROPI